MTQPDPLILSAFTMSTVSHGNAGLWRHPDDRTAGYTELAYWQDLARRLDAGGFDLLFIADAVGQLDVYGGSAREALARAVQTPVTDPLLAVSAMAAVTEHLGFGVTVSTTYEYPYLLARKLSTLDHLTGGRIGWNIVTSLLDSAARNILARDRQIAHDERYAIAQEFLEVAYKLWEGSWEDGAVLRDREGGIFTDPDKVHAIGHSGRYFSVPGAHLVEPSPQRTPLLLQAGTSPAGREFAARNAELVFVADPRPEVLRRNVDDIRSRAAGHGRRPEHVKFITSVTVVVDDTDRAAEAKARDLRRFRDTRGGLVLLSALSGVDWSEHDLDRPIEEFRHRRQPLGAGLRRRPGRPEAAHAARLRGRAQRVRRRGARRRRGHGRGRAGGVRGQDRCRRLQLRLPGDAGQLRRPGRASDPRAGEAGPGARAGRRGAAHRPRRAVRHGPRPARRPSGHRLPPSCAAPAPGPRSNAPRSRGPPRPPARRSTPRPCGSTCAAAPTRPSSITTRSARPRCRGSTRTSTRSRSSMAGTVQHTFKHRS
ncbi:NtaA/DmoA family FMN-dependent monooxygenase [Actinomadura rugatobispora]|uniref:NtaA/DmoA family FMN-dependent monooxygenase n=1 Tax=Actinomadura rugatobispora TaxID=1994 RepID=A0ABW0ZPZ8_9ACTN|nr:hypothetical protein GCM10010200_023500 [Actinomadura rugatobispora]